MGAWERAAKWVRRRPAVAALLASLVLVIVAGAAFGTWQLRSHLIEKERKEQALLGEVQEKDAKEKALNQVVQEKDAKEKALNQVVQEKDAKEKALNQVVQEKDDKLAVQKELIAKEQAAAAEKMKRELAEKDAKAKADAAGRAEDVAEDLRYFDRIALTNREWGAGHAAESNQLLDLCLPEDGKRDRRGWEWYLLKRRSLTTPESLSGYVGPLTCIAAGHDGKLATGGYNGFVKLWIVKDGEHKLTPITFCAAPRPGHGSGVQPGSPRPMGRLDQHAGLPATGRGAGPAHGPDRHPHAPASPLSGRPRGGLPS